MSFQFTPAELEEAERILARYPSRMSATLPLLHLAQAREGFISDGVVEEVARLVDVSPLHVADVVSFYTMYHRRAVGRHLISVCRTLSCDLMGKQKLVEYLCNRLQLGEAREGTDAQGQFTLEQVECLGACGGAPTIMIDGVYHERMTVEKLATLLDELTAAGGRDAQ